eukprot:1789339-Lingulodinium_polyedra.AAC.1
MMTSASASCGTHTDIPDGPRTQTRTRRKSYARRGHVGREPRRARTSRECGNVHAPAGARQP